MKNKYTTKSPNTYFVELAVRNPNYVFDINNLSNIAHLHCFNHRHKKYTRTYFDSYKLIPAISSYETVCSFLQCLGVGYFHVITYKQALALLKSPSFKLTHSISFV